MPTAFPIELPGIDVHLRAALSGWALDFEPVPARKMSSLSWISYFQ
jgi:hypothetical protein